MNGRKLFREYAQSRGKEAVSYVSITPQWYSDDLLQTKNSVGHLEEMTIDYREMVHWIIKTKKLV